jgi:hypothetical protein
MATVDSSRGSWRGRAPGAQGAATYVTTLLLVCASLSTAAPGPASSTVFRVFLADGTSIVSYGECARTGDRVVFTMPLGPSDKPSSLQLVSLPAGSVDWPRTLRYTEAVRSAHYAATRGDQDYAVLTADVARVLSELAVTAEPLRRLTMALQTRRYLQEWPGRHYGYRAADVQELVSVLEESVSSAKASAGQQSFDLSLVATIRSPEPPLLPAPTVAESLTGALAAARLADVPAERISLQEAVLRALDQHRDDLGQAFRRDLRTAVTPLLRATLREEQQYSRLRARAMKDARERAAQGDVLGVERVLDQIKKRDAGLGRRRPQDLLALTAAVEDQLEAARAQRLALDQFALRSETYRSYARELDAVFRSLTALSGEVEAVKAMAGPKPSALPRLIDRLRETSLRLALPTPPSQIRDAHAALQSAVHLMSEGFRMRREAIVANDVQLARNAASAAAGSLMLLARAKSDIDQFFTPPRLR